MSIIPILPDQVITHKDENGNEFYFRYLTGEYRHKYQVTQGEFQRKAVSFVGEAKKQLIESGISEPDEKSIVKKSIEIAKEKGIITSADEDKNMADIVDIFVKDWKGNGFPQLLPGKKPSDYLTITSLIELMVILSQYIEQLIGLTVEDQKN